MSQEKSGDEAKLNPMEKMRIRMAAEGYNSFNNPDSDEENEKGNGSKKAKKKQESHILVVFLVICTVIIVLLVVLLLVQLWMRKHDQTCMSPECVEKSGEILHMMDVTADPCQDFYQFACGYMDRDPLIPPDKPKYGAFSKVDQRNMGLIKKLLEQPGNTYSGGESAAIAKAKLVYNVCMNISEKEANTEKMQQLIGSLGGWPISDAGGKWEEAKFDLENTIGQIHLLGQEPLFGSGVSQDDKNSSLHRIVIDQGGLTLANYKNYLGNDTEKFKTAFLKFMSGVAELLGAEKDIANQHATDVWEFESKLAKALDPPESRQDVRKMYHLMTVEQLQQNFTDSFNVRKFFTVLFPDDPVKSTEHVVVYAPNFLHKMGDIVKATPKQTLANYMMWHVVMGMVPYLPQTFELLILEFRKVFSGTSAASPQWERCTVRASSTMAFAVGALFIDVTYKPSDKEMTEEILEYIRRTFESRLPGLDWMDETTKLKAIDKAQAVKQMIGYPEYIKDAAKLDDHYSKMEITNSSFDSGINAIKFGVNRNLAKRKKAPDPTEWSMGPSEVNAYYAPDRNQIVFPAGILSSPFYDPFFPMAINFGAIGMVMGHELTHGFDNMGRLYDKHGNMANWWGNESATNFEKKTQCLVDQYSQYKVGNDHLNGITTLGENVADNGGLKTSYKAYHTWLEEHAFKEPRPSLPGLNMTLHQMFFLGFSQMWCTMYTPEYAKQSLTTDVHSYSKYRVIGTLSNMPEFSEAFRCPQGSPMNPEKKCSVW